MTTQELVNLDPNVVRNDNDLIRLYIEAYKGVFGFTPNCAPCTFNDDFKRLKNAVKKSGENNVITIKEEKMENFELKIEYLNDIHSYKKDDQTYRIYGYLMTDDFAKEYLANGTKDEIEDRKKYFKTLPKEEVKTSKKNKK